MMNSITIAIFTLVSHFSYADIAVPLQTASDQNKSGNSFVKNCQRQIDAQLQDYVDPHYSKEDIKKLIQSVLVFGRTNSSTLRYYDCGSSNYISIYFNSSTCRLNVESSDSDGECK